jgi:hypothetical protein
MPFTVVIVYVLLLNIEESDGKGDRGSVFVSVVSDDSKVEVVIRNNI